MSDYERGMQDLREEIRARSDIVDIIGSYVKLKRNGKNWAGLCPFHADKNPSFTVSPTLQSYRCWACGEKGDVFSFIEKKESLEFIDAMEWLARRAGVPFERKRISPEKAGEREQMLELNMLAVRFFQEKLAKSPTAQKYLADRGVLKETQEQFLIGFAAPEWEGLTYFLQRGGSDLLLAERAGLIKRRESEGTGYYDAYRNRLIFPILDRTGRVVAFGGRVMDDSMPKYINGVESPLFSKSQTLYGLNFAHPKLAAGITPVFVEGYLDVITTHQAGITQCVATLGTAMTEEHVKMLARYSKKAIICYDSDKAGITAALKNAVIWEARPTEKLDAIDGVEAKIARLPNGEDPDSLIKSGGQAVFQVALDKAIPRVDYQIELALKRHDLSSEEGKKQALGEIIPIVASIASKTDRERHVQRLTHLHPAYEYNIGRAIESMLADAEAYARQTKGATSPRDLGYPLTEQANRGPLAENGALPSANYQPSQPGKWGSWRPNGGSPGWQSKGWSSKDGTQKDRSQYDSQNYRNREGGADRWKNRRDYRRENDDPGQYGPVPLPSQPLSGPEKAERQILRGLLSGDWRAYILSSLHPGYLVTERSRKVFTLISRMSPESDGGVDPIALLQLAEQLDTSEQVESVPGASASPHTTPETEETREDTLIASPVSDTADSSNSVSHRGAEADAWDVIDAEGAPIPEDDYLFISEEGVGPEFEEATVTSGTQARSHSARIVTFIRDLLEDSLSVMSNEPLSEAVINDCIRRLQKHREDQGKRELEEMLRRNDLTPEQQRACFDRYHETMRAMRGTPLDSA